MAMINLVFVPGHTACITLDCTCLASSMSRQYQCTYTARPAESDICDICIITYSPAGSRTRGLDNADACVLKIYLIRLSAYCLDKADPLGWVCLTIVVYLNKFPSLEGLLLPPMADWCCSRLDIFLLDPFLVSIIIFDEQ